MKMENTAKILICDENADFRRLTSEYLLGMGFAAPDEAANGEEALRKITLHRPDVVIIDPPRKGTTKELVDYLDSLGVKKIVYVSCGPDTLARDCKWFSEVGYQIGEVTPVDLFPGTGHVESVVCLTRR